MTKADIQAANDNLRDIIAQLNKDIDAADGIYQAIRAKIKTLKFVARHYKKQRDQVDAYLSAVLDLTLETPAPAEDGRMPLPGGAGGDRVMRHDPPLPLTTRPSVEPPRGVDDERYPGFKENDRIAWEDF